MNTMIAYGAAAFATLSIAASAQARHHRSSSSMTSNTTRENGNVRSCADLNVQFGYAESRKSEARITVSRAEASGLEIEPSQNGGVYVQGTEGVDLEVTLCKAVPDGDGASAELDKITLSRHGNRIGVDGPAGGDWVAQMIVHAPQNSSIVLKSENGPVSLRGFDGTATIAVANGPVSLRGCRGQISVDSQNGPIHVSESSGNVTLDAENGPLSVHLADGGWSGGKLYGRTENGPVSLELPYRVGSGVRVESAGRSPFQCHGEGCQSARRDWDDDHKRIEFGGADPVVRLSTVNGPVSIDSGN
jgi:DUF4097 and DUF4098 domain-containing protein YvlB